MKVYLPIIASVLLANSAIAQERPWQTISDPTAAKLTADFGSPPPEYSAQFVSGFSDTPTRQDIGLLLDRANSVHVQAAFIEPKFGGKSPYLSSSDFDAVKILVEEAINRNMRLCL